MIVFIIHHSIKVNMHDGMNILVAYDGSIHADNALIEAVKIGGKFYAHIDVLYCSWDESEQNDLTLLKTRENFLENSGVSYTLRCEPHEHVWKTIVDVADREMSGLIVMGTRGMGTAKSMVMGSVSRKVIENSLCPVLTVK